jgi:hypothetical protein
MISHRWCLARRLLFHTAGSQNIQEQEEEHMMRSIGFALALVTLLMTTAAIAAPPDEVNAPRSQQDEVQAPRG